jgi:ParB family chromosome partitioning protein
MSKESTSVTDDLQRKDMYFIAPERLTIVVDEQASLFDERAHKPPAEKMIKSVFVNGVIQPVQVRKNGPAIEVIDGRKRTMAAIEANRRLVASGAEPIKIPIVFKRGEPVELAEMIVYLNEIREDDGLLVKARKAQRLLNRGRSEEQVATAFGLESTATIANWLKLLECTPKVQALVDAGKVRLTDAKKISALPEAEQVAEAERIMAEAPTQRERKAKGEVKKRVANPQSRLKKFLRAFASDEAKGTIPGSKAWKASLLDWILGDLSGASLVTEHEFLAPLTAKASKKTAKTKKAA